MHSCGGHVEWVFAEISQGTAAECLGDELSVDVTVTQASWRALIRRRGARPDMDYWRMLFAQRVWRSDQYD
eukprot:6224067-Heterocapsa_arctica.AAC.1